MAFADPISLSISVNWRRQAATCAALFLEDTVRKGRYRRAIDDSQKMVRIFYLGRVIDQAVVNRV